MAPVVGVGSIAELGRMRRIDEIDSIMYDLLNYEAGAGCTFNDIAASMHHHLIDVSTSMLYWILMQILPT